VVGATITISGSDITIDNCIFNLTGINNITVGFTVTGIGIIMKNCHIGINDSAAHAVATVFSLSVNSFMLLNCVVDGTGSATGTVALFSSVSAMGYLRVVGCEIRGNFSTAVFSSSGANHITNLVIAYNLIRQSNGTAKNIFNLTTSSTGIIAYNVFNGTTWSSAADVASNSTSTSLRWFENYGFDDGAGAVSGVLVPAAGTLA